ncbi:uncharacterized protein A4U43_C02F5120 [Asparagus officinalis]|uniref:Ricin B lectin domain-containing protein n=1 Tax=Asparagus officinalis TaxID=4686 RepID=A0A5P1FL34_ASPOF|nr:uncharacterized protein A4U43_C02F5120 [Asparagus officinalis]
MARLVLILILVLAHENITAFCDELKSEKLCRQCSARRGIDRCPPSEAYPHMTAWDDSLIAGALMSDFVPMKDGGVYAVPNVKGGESELNAYYGWESTSGSASGFHRFINYMDKCSNGHRYLSVIDEIGTVGLQPLTSLKTPAQAEWKTLNPPPNFNHNGLRFWMNRFTGKCLTVLDKGSTQKRVVGVTECEPNGSNPLQLFAFRFHYHKAFCCCGLYIT